MRNIIMQIISLLREEVIENLQTSMLKKKELCDAIYSTLGTLEEEEKSRPNRALSAVVICYGFEKSIMISTLIEK
jgi:hypothetical protein